VGFLGEQVLPVGLIELPITAGTFPSKWAIMVKFLLVDRPSAYNTIIGRITINELKSMTSTPHLSMKFPTTEAVKVVKGDQVSSRGSSIG
jgi:hypothetical protein